MNERIRELTKQATIRVNNPTVNSNGKVICDNWEEGVSLSKFAELIVRECVIQCEREWIRNGTDSVHNQAIHGCINRIQEHFGVEE